MVLDLWHIKCALERVIHRYGGHLIALTEDSPVKASEKQKMKGYRGEGKALLGCAFFVDLLKPASFCFM